MSVPKHVAIIMDGNGRWAKKRFLAKSAGHRAGATALKNLCREVEKTEVEYLTVYAFSTENWNRSEQEVKSLMTLLDEYLSDSIKDVDKNNVRMHIIGDIDALSQSIKEKIATLRKLTKNKTGLNVVIALNYGSRDEITRAAKKIAADASAGKISKDDIDQELFASYLDTKGIPEPELLIRTSGELRLSNFMLWQLAYTELYFVDKYWPDFNINDFKRALKDYEGRERRFGK